MDEEDEIRPYKIYGMEVKSMEVKVWVLRTFKMAVHMKISPKLL